MQREFYIAGVKFHDLNKVINELKEGHYLDLVPEPSNKFDTNAVQLIFNGTMCGYVPKIYSAEISAAIETYGSAIKCKVIEVNPKAKQWEQCKVAVYFEKAEDRFDIESNEDLAQQADAARGRGDDF